MKSKRIAIAILTGSILGIFCIIGASARVGLSGNELFLFALWYNRFLMGIVIGVASGLEIIKTKWNVLLRGGILGLIVTSAFFLSTGFRDIPSFFAGIVYGLIIDYIATKFE
jgi:hypothetical protein